MSLGSGIRKFFGIEEVNIQDDRGGRLRHLVKLIVWAHVIAVGLSAGAAVAFLKWAPHEWNEPLILTLHILSLAAFMIGMMILLLTALNEALARETLAMAK